MITLTITIKVTNLHSLFLDHLGIRIKYQPSLTNFNIVSFTYTIYMIYLFILKGKEILAINRLMPFNFSHFVKLLFYLFLSMNYFRIFFVLQMSNLLISTRIQQLNSCALHVFSFLKTFLCISTNKNT